MLKPLICGSFHNQEEEGERWSSPVSMPGKSRKSNKNSKNPYSARGLDKFSELVADLEKKRKEIHSKVGPEDVYVVRFKYSNSNNIVPVVIKLKDRKQDKTKAIGDVKEDIRENKSIIRDTEVLDKFPIESQSPEKDVKQSRLVEADRKTEEEEEKKKKKKKSLWNLNLHKLRRPAYYVPVFVVLILLFLVFFGRSVAILCTSVGWYILPTLDSKTPTTKKKQYRRGFSEITMASGNGLFSPKSKNNGAVKSKSFQFRRASSPPG